MNHLVLVVVEPGLEGLDHGVLRERSLQPDQILNVSQPTLFHLRYIKHKNTCRKIKIYITYNLINIDVYNIQIHSTLNIY